MPHSHLLQWIELSESALNNNLDTLKRLAGNRLLAPSIKANAYGHGLEEMVRLLLPRADVPYVSVHSLEEAIECRSFGWDRKIMVLGPVALEELESVVEWNLEPVVTTPEVLETLGKLSRQWQKPIGTHVKLETGTNRQGVASKELKSFARLYAKYPELGGPAGASTHFANIEDTTSHEYAQFQLDNFRRLIKEMTSLGIKPRLKHTASSAALILFDKTRFDLVRPGLSLYGHWPSKETYLSYRLAGGENQILTPVLSWRTRVTQVKDIPADSFIGYGCTYRTTSPTKLAILPIGYFDGYDRGLSNQAHVLIQGKRAPVRGRICMNLMMVDVTDISRVPLEAPVTLIGRDRQEYLSAEQLATWAGTINYEFLARLGQHIPKIITI